MQTLGHLWLKVPLNLNLKEESAKNQIKSFWIVLRVSN